MITMEMTIDGDFSVKPIGNRAGELLLTYERRTPRSAIATWTLPRYDAVVLALELLDALDLDGDLYRSVQEAL